jgi:multiple sugar transport system permease protein
MTKTRKGTVDDEPSAAAAEEGPEQERLPLRSRIADGDLGGYLLLAPAVLILMLLTIWPFIYSLVISVTDYKAKSGKPTKWVGLGNFIDLFKDDTFVTALTITGKFTLIAIPLQLILGYVCARILAAAHDMPGARIFRTFFIVPTMMTSLAVALFWGYILDPLLGVGNWVLLQLGLPQQQWFTSPSSAFPTVVAVYLWQWVPFTAMLFMAGLLSIPRQIYEAASIDGARWYQQVLNIDLPLLKRVGAIAGILATVEVIRLFDLVYGTTQGGPGTTTLTNAIEIFRIGFQNFNTAYAAAASLLILVVTILISQLFVRALDDKEQPA